MKTTSEVVTTTRTRTAAKTPALFYAVLGGARPTSGGKLYAHTFAALSVLGITTAKGSALSSHLRTLIGDRAVNHHTGVANLVERNDRVSLTKQGVLFFAERFKSHDGKAPRCSTDMVDRYMTVMQKGRADASLGITKDHLKAYYG